MKKIFLLTALFCANASALDFADGTQYGGFGVVASAFQADGVWTVTTTNGTEIVIDGTTPLKFKGSSKVKSIADLKPGNTAITVNWCVIHQGKCDTRQGTMSIYGFDPAAVDNKVMFEVGKTLTEFNAAK